MKSRISDLTSLFARSWFPLALISLLLIGLPVLFLFLLNLFGLETWLMGLFGVDGTLSGWLESQFHLSYQIPIPWWGALLILFIPLAILLLYFLKLKRKPLAVPSTFLWKKSIEDLHVNALFQWLRENVLLLLQILTVLGLIYGLMSFRLHGRTGEGKHYIIMVDNSASMNASDVSPSRLEAAKQEALKEIDAATDNDVGMVIVFSSSAEIRQSYTSNRGLLRAAVEKIEPTQRPTRIDEALTLADSLANPNRATEDVASRPAGEDPSKARSYVTPEGIGTEVHLFSDGRFPDVPEFSLGNLNVHYHAAGKLVLEASGQGQDKSKPQLKPDSESSDNIGIVTMNAVREEQDPSKLQVFVGVRNFRRKVAQDSDPVASSQDRNPVLQVEVRLELLINGQLRDAYGEKVSLKPREVTVEKEAGKEVAVLRDSPGEGAATFELNDVDDRANVVLHAQLLKVKDKFPLDDEAWLVVGVIRKARVLIVGPPNDHLNAFFINNEATEKVAAVTHLSPEDLDKDAYLKAARGGAYDLVIFDRCGPKTEKDMPRSNTFFIGYPPPPWKKETLEKLDSPIIKGWMDKHSIMRGLVELYKVGVAEAFKIKDLPPRTPRLIETDREAAVLVALSRASFTDLVMTFPLIDDKGLWNTNWPELVSFPLFLRNVLYTLGNVSDAASEENVQPGQVKILRPDASVKRIGVLNPAGKEQTLSHEERETRTDFSYGNTDQVGIYNVKWNDAVQRSFAVNLLDSDESNIEPRPAIQIGTEQLVAGQERSQPREIWKWFALAALLLLLLEWYIYNKRIYI